MKLQAGYPTKAISIIIPARNEQEHLPACLESIFKSSVKGKIPVEIIVVINRCSDRTEQIAVAAGCRVTYNDSKNLSQIRNCGVSLASHEMIITVDADSTISENMLPTVLDCLLQKNIVGGGVLIIPERFSLGIILTALGLLPVLLWHTISAGLFFFHKSDFDAIGGFDESYVSVEDLDFARRLKQHGKKTGRKFKNIFRAYIRTSCRKFDKFGDWYFIRNPAFFIRLLRGRNVSDSNKFWYDIER